MPLHVLMVPENHEYINKLKESLTNEKLSIITLKPFHWRLPENIIKMLLWYFRGGRIVHIHWLYVFPFAWMMKLFVFICKPVKIKIIWEMHNIVPHGASLSEFRCSRWFYNHIDAIIYHSKEDVQRARKILESSRTHPFIIVPHGNFNASYPNEIDKPAARRKLGIDQKRRVLLCFGFIRRNRGYPYLVKAVRDIPNVTLLVVGKIWHKDAYEELLTLTRDKPDILIRTGWISDNDIQIYFNACDAVVLPYTEVTTSGVIPLAYAFKRPVIASKIGGVKEVVTQEIGFLVPPKDTMRLKETIVSALEQDLKTMGEKAYLFAQKEWSWESIARKIKVFYQSLMP